MHLAMSLLSVQYACFVAGVFAIHWTLPARFRWLTVLAASVAFVAVAAPETLCLVAFMVTLSYCAAVAIRKRNAKGRAATFLFRFSVIALLVSLAFFKYGNFAKNLLTGTVAVHGQGDADGIRRFFLPIGISFWTFSILSYLFDVRKGRIEAETHFGRYAAYVLFFPKFLSGPIDRAGNFLPQIVSPKQFAYDRAVRGMRQIAIGLFRKIVVADALANYTDRIFGAPSRFCSMALLIGAVFYSLQIYNDFAGYSDIAIGSARLLGIDLADNFRAPCFAKSLKDFWSRWHISLSTWFRDYLYIPLGGSRCGAWRTRFNLFVTFVVSGLWHGANVTFVAWGAIHGLCQIAEKLLWPEKRRECSQETRMSFLKRGSLVFRWGVTFSVVSVAWIFFRAESISAAAQYLSRLSQFWRSPLYGFAKAIGQLHISFGVAMQLILPLAFLAVWDGISLARDPFEAFGKLPGLLRWLAYAALISALLFVLLPQGQSSQNFIYYKF